MSFVMKEIEYFIYPDFISGYYTLYPDFYIPLRTLPGRKKIKEGKNPKNAHFMGIFRVLYCNNIKHEL